MRWVEWRKGVSTVSIIILLGPTANWNSRFSILRSIKQAVTFSFSTSHFYHTILSLMAVPITHTSSDAYDMQWKSQPINVSTPSTCHSLDNFVEEMNRQQSVTNWFAVWNARNYIHEAIFKLLNLWKILRKILHWVRNNDSIKISLNNCPS